METASSATPVQNFVMPSPQLPSHWYRSTIESRHVPASAAVYVVLDNAGRVAYVGQTTNVRRRFIDHKKWMDKDMLFGWICIDTSELLFHEAALVAALRPYRNRNTSKSVPRFIPQDSATISASPEKVWVKGRFAEVYSSAQHHGRVLGGVIQYIYENTIVIDGVGYNRKMVSVRLA